MKSLPIKSVFLLFIGSIWNFSGYSQSTSISGVVNNYLSVNSIVSGTCNDTIFFSGPNVFSEGDIGLIIQMQGALIDTSNVASFGSILNTNSAGSNEIFRVLSVGINFLVTQDTLQRTYNLSGKVQLVSIPEYANAAITNMLTCLPWNGQTGGVLAIYVNDTLNLAADIDVSGKGFRGGSVSNNIYSTWFTGYYCTYGSGRGGMKGEGICSVPPSMAAGRGAPANGGGGGNDINTGGGGGANIGMGGHGGNNYYAPGFLWGEGGRSIPSNLMVNPDYFMGGGGGGGHHNNTEGTSGGNGGGIILLLARTIRGNGFSVSSNGSNVNNTAIRDGAGGGGAGGTIVVLCDSYINSCNITAKGGKGGDQVYLPQCHGNGGGGGGGRIIKGSLNPFPANVTTNVSGGLKGSGQCNNTTNDAQNGSQGSVEYFDMNSVISNLVVNLGPDLTICEGDSILIGISTQNGIGYLWNTGELTSQISVNPSQTTTYILTVSIGSGQCIRSETDTIVVTVLQNPSVSVTYSNTCNGLEIGFAANSSQFNNHFWSFGDGITSTVSVPVHTFQTPGDYMVTLEVEWLNGCKTFWSDSINVSFKNPPEAIIGYEIENCERMVSFHSDTSKFDYISWYLTSGDTSNLGNFIYNFPSQGVFDVLAVASNECGIDSTELSVQIYSFYVSNADFTSTIEVCDGLVIFKDKSTHSSSWLWDFGDGSNSILQNPLHQYDIAGSYQVVLYINNSNFCSDSITQFVVVEEGGVLKYFIPNAFTPNGDGKNDVFEWLPSQICEPYSFSIFNRWGELIFQTYSEIVRWDGTHNSQFVESGVYFYKLQGKLKSRFGSITVVR